jgi:hypothetical protein
MKSNMATGESSLKQPLKGWRWLTAWIFLIFGLSALTWIILGLTSNDSFNPAIFDRGLLSIGIAIAIAILLAVLVHCLFSWRNLKRLRLGIACLAGLVALFYAEEDIRGKLAWSRFKANWEAKGEKFNFSGFIPASVAEDQNFAMAPVVATSYRRILDSNGQKISPPDTNVVDQLQMPLDLDNSGPAHANGNWQKGIRSNLEPWQRYYRKLSQTTNVFPVASQPQSPAGDVLLALSKYESNVEQLRQAAARPASRFPLNYSSEEPFAILLPHLAPLKGCAVLLRQRSVAEIEDGQSAAALADIRLALSLIDKIRSEPFLISHLVRIAMLQITEQAIWEGLAAHCWNDAQLSELNQQLGGLDFVADYAAAMRGENACHVATVDFLRHRPGLLDSIGESSDHHSFRLGDLGGCLIPSGWFSQNELRCSRFILEQFLPVADVSRQTFSPDLVAQAGQSLLAMRLTPYTLLCKMLLPALTKSAHRFAFAQAALNLSRIACALERYRIAKGKYPDTLEALATEFIAKIPSDPIGGQPMRYHLDDDQHLVLYSIGWNEKDDDGHVVLTSSGSVDLDKGDWVWRYSDEGL